MTVLEFLSDIMGSLPEFMVTAFNFIFYEIHSGICLLGSHIYNFFYEASDYDSVLSLLSVDTAFFVVGLLTLAFLLKLLRR